MLLVSVLYQGTAQVSGGHIELQREKKKDSITLQKDRPRASCHDRVIRVRWSSSLTEKKPSQWAPPVRTTRLPSSHQRWQRGYRNMVTSPCSLLGHSLIAGNDDPCSSGRAWDQSTDSTGAWRRQHTWAAALTVQPSRYSALSSVSGRELFLQEFVQFVIRDGIFLFFIFFLANGFEMDLKSCDLGLTQRDHLQINFRRELYSTLEVLLTWLHNDTMWW